MTAATERGVYKLRMSENVQKSVVQELGMCYNMLVKLRLMEAKKMAKKKDRFEVVLKEGAQLKDSGLRQILVDTETGVNYLVWKAGYAGGITPLLDSEGKVIITKTIR